MTFFKSIVVLSIAFKGEKSQFLIIFMKRRNGCLEAG